MTDHTDCRICDEQIDGGEAVVVLEVYESTWFGGELSLNADAQGEVLIHLSCLDDLVTAADSEGIDP